MRLFYQSASSFSLLRVPQLNAILHNNKKVWQDECLVKLKHCILRDDVAEP